MAALYECLWKYRSGAAAVGACLLIAGCAMGDWFSEPDARPRGAIVQTPGNFDAALRQNQVALAERRGAQDVALYNIGLILAHPLNPRRDYGKAAQSFNALVTEHPRSAYVDQAKTWIHVLELQQKLVDERRALNREKELLQQERQRLNYATEKSHQLDIEIDRRRRQSLGR